MIDNLKDVHRVQGYDGNWNYDPYMFGLYNGLEMALAIMENREPVFREKPKKWMKTSRKKHSIAREVKSELGYSRVENERTN